MKSRLVSATVAARFLFVAVAAFTAIVSTNVLAQRADNGKTPYGEGIYVIRIGHIVTNHPRFKADMDKLQQWVNNQEAALAQEQKAIMVLKRELATLIQGTDNHTRKDDEITKRLAALNLKVTQLKKKVRDDQLRMRGNVYSEIKTEVARLAELHNMGLVLRWSGLPQSGRHVEVVMNMNQPIVYVNPARDISQHVLNNLKARQQPLGRRDSKPDYSAKVIPDQNFQRPRR